MSVVTPPVFQSIKIAVLTVSDTRTEATDASGATLIELFSQDGHQLFERRIVTDNKYRIRAQLSQWIIEPEVRVILITGGTGFADRDVTPEALEPLLDKTIPGFGEMFRTLSMADIGSSTFQSRALAGIANGTFIFCLPGSTGACRTAWEQLLRPQLDNRTRPCNIVKLLENVAKH